MPKLKDVDRYTRESWAYHNEMTSPTNYLYQLKN
jgi:hypothetical protein